MSNDTIATLPDPSGFSPDPLSGLIRDGARKLIEQAIEAKLAALLETLLTRSSKTGGHACFGTVTCRNATC